MITKDAKPVALLVTSQFNQTVREYNGATGAFVKVAASGGAPGDPLGLVFGLDGNLLVSDGQTNQVKRYDSATGVFIDVFASTKLAGPTGMAGKMQRIFSRPIRGLPNGSSKTFAKTPGLSPTAFSTNPA
jgi:hypothetical protein